MGLDHALRHQRAFAFGKRSFEPSIVILDRSLAFLGLVNEELQGTAKFKGSHERKGPGNFDQGSFSNVPYGRQDPKKFGDVFLSYIISNTDRRRPSAGSVPVD